jgi:hypothetical protein
MVNIIWKKGIRESLDDVVLSWVKEWSYAVAEYYLEYGIR